MKTEYVKKWNNFFFHSRKLEFYPTKENYELEHY